MHWAHAGIAMEKGPTPRVTIPSLSLLVFDLDEFLDFVDPSWIPFLPRPES